MQPTTFSISVDRQKEANNVVIYNGSDQIMAEIPPARTTRYCTSSGMSLRRKDISRGEKLGVPATAPAAISILSPTTMPPPSWEPDSCTAAVTVNVDTGLGDLPHQVNDDAVHPHQVLHVHHLRHVAARPAHTKHKQRARVQFPITGCSRLWANSDRSLT